MVYIGALAVVFAAFLIWREYCGYLDGELSFCRAFCLALSDYREKMRCYLVSPYEWGCEYSDDLLEECGFLDNVKNGKSFYDAYLESKGKMVLSSEAEKTVLDCFERLGEGDLACEADLLGAAVDKLSGMADRADGECKKRKKAFGALIGAFALGIVIFVV